MIIIKYSDTLISKNKLKKLLLLKFFCNQNAQKNQHIQFITNTHTNRHKNVLLSSPFHFKTVKSHLYIPTFTFYLVFNKFIVINLLQFKFIGGFNSIYSEKLNTIII